MALESLAQAISIHAPAWGATSLSLIQGASRGNSIHAPPWGATPLSFPLFFLECISIHAPAWGATNANFPDKLSLRYFNPRARVGRDVETSTTNLIVTTFQSTRPRGARQRHRRRYHGKTIISIHAPAWGATSQLLFDLTLRRDFNPRARVGRDARFSRSRSAS